MPIVALCVLLVSNSKGNKIEILKFADAMASPAIYNVKTLLAMPSMEYTNKRINF